MPVHTACTFQQAARLKLHLEMSLISFHSVLSTGAAKRAYVQKQDINNASSTVNRRRVELIGQRVAGDLTMFTYYELHKFNEIVQLV